MTPASPRRSRRSFLSQAWRVAGFGLLAGSGVLVGRVLSGAPRAVRRVQLSAAELSRAVRAGGATVGELFVTGPPEAPIALRMRCTHLGCRLQHDAERGELACPCHGSRFDLSGAVLKGPAGRPLDRPPTRTHEEGWEVTL